ncbi:MAG TPA: copper-containing nitrite reductase [Candidatus Eisenbacteria bacterium]|nr:copper-containing nitrite reductase [Candidatus Eisenbacteria bacterium]
MKTRTGVVGFLVVVLLSAPFFSSRPALAAEEAVKSGELLPVVEAELTAAPSVPAPIERDFAARVIVRLSSDEFRGDLSRGVQYDYWGYNKQVPGPFVRVREGDTIEFHFKNSADSKNTHTIDFHSMTGPCGAACVLSTEPGKEAIVSAKAVSPGLFVYHCGAQPIPVHISNGLYGLILVQPAKGLPKVDHEYYVMQSEFYTEQPIGTKGLATFSSQKGLDERPTYVVFNGRVGALMDENALQAKTGETIRLYVGNIGPNLASSFHVIGMVFDKVYREGSLTNPGENIQTTLIPSGSASTVEFKALVPGDYTMVDHSIFRINKGATGQIHVEGPERPDILNQIQGGE